MEECIWRLPLCSRAICTTAAMMDWLPVTPLLVLYNRFSRITACQSRIACRPAMATRHCSPLSNIAHAHTHTHTHTRSLTGATLRWGRNCTKLCAPSLRDLVERTIAHTAFRYDGKITAQLVTPETLPEFLFVESNLLSTLTPYDQSRSRSGSYFTTYSQSVGMSWY
jgi:hypothetical protein